MDEHLIDRLRGGSMANADGGQMGGVVSTMADAADEIEQLRGLLNTTAARNRTLARALRRLKHTDGEQ